MEIGQKIKRIRQILEMTQPEFAQNIGVTQATLSRIESGKQETGYSTLARIALSFNIDLNWLIIDKGEPPKHLESWKKPDALTESEGISA